jgi:hypothetical protein
LVVDLPPGVQRRREFVPLVFDSSGYVAKLARLHIKQWAEGRRGDREWRRRGASDD